MSKMDINLIIKAGTVVTVGFIALQILKKVIPQGNIGDMFKKEDMVKNDIRYMDYAEYLNLAPKNFDYYKILGQKMWLQKDFGKALIMAQKKMSATNRNTLEQYCGELHLLGGFDDKRAVRGFEEQFNNAPEGYEKNKYMSLHCYGIALDLPVTHFPLRNFQKYDLYKYVLMKFPKKLQHAYVEYFSILKGMGVFNLGKDWKRFDPMHIELKTQYLIVER